MHRLHSRALALPSAMRLVVACAVVACSGSDKPSTPVGPGPSSGTGTPPHVVAWETIPRVIGLGSADPVQLRAIVTGDAATVTFSVRGFGAKNLTLSPTSETVALTGLPAATAWQVTTNAIELLAGFPAIGGSNFVGRIGATGKDGLEAESFSMAAIVQGDWPTSVTVQRASENVQIADHVLNVRVGLDGDAILQTIPSELGPIASAVTAIGADPDFLLLVPPVFFPTVGTAGYLTMRNDTKGIGALVADRTLSAPFTALQPLKRLQGLIVVRDPAKIDLAAPNVVHEVGHRFMAYLEAVYGLPGTTGHWPISELANGVMGYQRGTTSERFAYRFERQPDATFIMRPNAIAKRFNSMELYLMGLLEPSAVDSFLVFSNPSALPLPGDGVRITAAWRYINADSVIGVVGAREPSVATAPKQFRMLTVVLTRGRLLTSEEMAYYDHAATRGEATEPVLPLDVGQEDFLEPELPFAVATGGRGAITTRVR